MNIETVQSRPYEGQLPGTSGLRKRVTVFQQPGYTENFLEAIFSVLRPKLGEIWIIGGDGRYYSETIIQIVIQMAAAHGVSKLVIGHKGILSTPAASWMIRTYQAAAGLLLTASHNAGGPNGDFGIKLNMSNGGSAPETIIHEIYKYTKNMTRYITLNIENIDLSEIGTRIEKGLTVEIVDPVQGYVDYLMDIFDFELIRAFFRRFTKFRMLFDGLHGVTGPYAKEIFLNRLGLPPASLQNCVPLPDFGGGHPDPNLTYAKTLITRVDAEKIDVGFASDGDGDRNMVYCVETLVSPCDCLALIAHHAEKIPYFKKNRIFGYARSMPTSRALDLVAEKKGLRCYEVPTGWKFFCTLFDHNKISICGEESFGIGSNHIREKDGLWGVLSWLNILAAINMEHEDQQFKGILDILDEFWEIYGRTYFSRYDYEEIDGFSAGKALNRFSEIIHDDDFIGSSPIYGYKVQDAGDFSYHDSITGETTEHQGLYINFSNRSRIVVRLSGTGSCGATIRIYIEKYEADRQKFHLKLQDVLRGLFEYSLSLLNLKEYIGTCTPTVIT
ncbi:hypothetical protein PNEG_00993 [Pneumocystis murina B123]|uniref:phosphoglucomutase (alpha-D-glucose-1,6-bisphosphate-dependent) n=1 Tax=Pneumocystis murina (strain B123) TaxID=1069680 RepID=M7NU88_PNEMU|nr:hypothetical protein PNEG_00993 [Pneumocystis murina B123]EMR10847.1 hypothetical protein PNEG_00993 [Pneumocystis murina B123]